MKKNRFQIFIAFQYNHETPRNYRTNSFPFSDDEHNRRCRWVSTQKMPILHQKNMLARLHTTFQLPEAAIEDWKNCKDIQTTYSYSTNLHGLNPDDPGMPFCDITNAWESIIMETWHNYKQFIDIDVKEKEIYIKGEQKLKILQKTFPNYYESDSEDSASVDYSDSDQVEYLSSTSDEESA